MSATRKLYKRCVRPMCALWARCAQQLIALRKNVMVAVRTLWERRLDAVGTLWGRFVNGITINDSLIVNLIVLGIFRGDPNSALADFLIAVQTLWHRRLVWQGLYLQT